MPENHVGSREGLRAEATAIRKRIRINERLLRELQMTCSHPEYGPSKDNLYIHECVDCGAPVPEADEAK